MLPHPKVKYNTHLYLANMYCLDATKKCGDLNSPQYCMFPKNSAIKPMPILLITVEQLSC